MLLSMRILTLLCVNATPDANTLYENIYAQKLYSFQSLTLMANADRDSVTTRSTEQPVLLATLCPYPKDLKSIQITYSPKVLTSNSSYVWFTTHLNGIYRCEGWLSSSPARSSYLLCGTTGFRLHLFFLRWLGQADPNSPTLSIKITGFLEWPRRSATLVASQSSNIF